MADGMLTDRTTGRVVAAQPGFAEPFTLDDCETYLNNMERRA